MNMKLLAGLAVAITLASAMSFVALSSRDVTEPDAQSSQASGPKVDNLAPKSPSGSQDNEIGVNLEVSDEPNVHMKLEVK